MAEVAGLKAELETSATRLEQIQLELQALVWASQFATRECAGGHGVSVAVS